jgi:glycosyltransferase involved in cell wall biosynthesis
MAPERSVISMTELFSKRPYVSAAAALPGDALFREAGPEIAVIVPCYNEEITVAKVIGDFRRALPTATIYVCDNNSSDHTAERAREAGAEVIFEPLPGKGNAVRRLFADVEADVYVLADGDDTYDAAAASGLVRHLLRRRLDMVNGSRVTEAKLAYRFGHRLGNRLFSWLVARCFGNRFSDILSGYRVLSRRYVKSFPAQVRGFDIETEMTVHALEMRMPVAELAIVYRERPAGSFSKLSTYKDGVRIMWRILVLLKEERPMQFFGAVFGALALASAALAYPLFVTYFETGLVPRLPTGVLASAMMLLAFVSLTCGLILDTVTRGRRELKRMFYLSIPPVGGRGRRAA